MTEYTVTYRLTQEQETAIRELANESGRTLDKEFELMMEVGSRWDIDRKVEMWQGLTKNSKNKRA